MLCTWQIRQSLKVWSSQPRGQLARLNRPMSYCTSGRMVAYEMELEPRFLILNPGFKSHGEFKIVHYVSSNSRFIDGKI